MISPVYTNLNKIDSVLKEEFGSENVLMEHIEKKDASGGFDFDYKFTIESDNYTMKMVINGHSALMMENDLSWSYYEDSNNEDSNLINRNSRLDNLGNTIQEIFEKKMFSKLYLESVMVLINEDVDAEPILKRPLFLENNNNLEISKEAMKELLDNYGVNLKNINESQFEIEIEVSSHGEISKATMVDVESVLDGFEVVEDAYFSGISHNEDKVYYYKLNVSFTYETPKLVD